MLVEQTIKACDTGQVWGLSQQILENLINKQILVKIDHPLIVCTGRQNNPYLQPEAYRYLVKAVEKRGVKLIINSCLRTVVQQYILWRQANLKLCGITAAATPGRSNHQSSLAIDIEDYQQWKYYLQLFKWKWIGAFDPVHFDFTGGGQNLSYLQIVEFQRLWNRYNPQDRIAEDGIWGRNTASKVAKSPAAGFGKFQVMRKGDYFQAVGEMQLLLRKALNYSPSQLAADNHFGDATYRAVRKFQAKVGLEVDGIVGEKTMNLLEQYG